MAAVLIVLGAIGSGTRSSSGGHFRICDSCDRREFAGTKFKDCRGPFGIKLLFCRDCRKSRPFPTVFSISNVTTDRSNGDRIEAWKKAAVMIQDKPVFGFGILQGGRPIWPITAPRLIRRACIIFITFMSKRPWTAVLSALWDLLPGSFPSFYLFRHVENPYAFAGFCAWIGFCTVGMFDYTLGMSAAVKTPLFS